MGKGNSIQTGCFAASYWVTGKVMPQDGNTKQPPDTMTDTALQILKLAEFGDLSPDAKQKNVTHQLIDDIHIPWLVELDRLDIRQAYAWPHTVDEGINTFRLDDHFWIWKALKFLDDNATKVPIKRKSGNDQIGSKMFARYPELKPRSKEGQTSSDMTDRYALLTRLYEGKICEASEKLSVVAQRLSPNNVQRGILQRFTTMNDISRRRMLAVTRSARENRFLLHARDTALFYGEDCDFFPRGSSFQKLWMNTIETQRHHEENQQIAWENALRYALGVLMGVRGHSLSETNASDLVKECVAILLGSGGHDAFFPGELEGGRDPIMFCWK